MKLLRKNELTKSPQTTACGILLGISGLCTALIPLLDGDPQTVFSAETLWAALMQIAMAVGLIKARDHGVTSEQAREP